MPIPPDDSTPRRGFLRRHFGKWIALSQYGFPFSFGSYPTPVAEFRALARGARFAGRSPRRVAAKVAMTLTWPFGAFWAARRTCRSLQAWRQSASGVRVFLDMYGLALRESIPPLEYALYRFNDPRRRAERHEYLYWNDLPALGALNARLGADTRDVQDKDRFARICAAHAFPHVPTLAVFDKGRQVFPVAPFAPDLPSIWTKSLRLKNAAADGKWIKDDDAYRGGGRRVPIAALAAEFGRHDCLVQPFVENHPRLAPMTKGLLTPLRIVTGLDEKGCAELVTALLGVPHEGHGSGAAAIFCSVAPDTGRLRHAVLPDGTPVINHPGTGVPIADIEVPFWRDSLDLVRRAHARAFPRFAFLGWDVALTPDGPVLLETNEGWGAIFHQLLDGPIGHTAFSRLVGQYV